MENRSGDRARSTPRKRQPITAGRVPERVLKSQSTDRRRGPQKCTQGLRRAVSERQFFQGEGGKVPFGDGKNQGRNLGSHSKKAQKNTPMHAQRLCAILTERQLRIS